MALKPAPGSAGISTGGATGINLRARLRQRLIGYMDSGGPADQDRLAQYRVLQPMSMRIRRRMDDGSVMDVLSEGNTDINRVRIKGVPVDETEYLIDEIQVFLEQGMVDTHDAWVTNLLRSLGGASDTEQLPGYLYPPIGLVRLLEEHLGTPIDDTEFYRLAQAIWVDYTSLGLTSSLLYGPPDANAEQEAIEAYEAEQSVDAGDGTTPTGTATRAYEDGTESIPWADEWVSQRLSANRWFSPILWYQQAAGVGGFREMTEASLGAKGPFPWLDFCLAPTASSTWGLYTLLRYPEEATETLPATMRFFAVNLSVKDGVQFWELPVPGSYADVITAYFALGREDYDNDTFALRYERMRIRAHILSSLSPPDVYNTSTPQVPDYAIGAADLGMDLVAGQTLWYGFHMSPMGERFALCTRYPIYRESGSAHESPGINRWRHDLFRGTCVLDEDKLVTEGAAEFELTWSHDETHDFTAARSRDWLYHPSTRYPNMHFQLQFDTEGKEDDYQVTGPGEFGIYEGEDVPYYIYYKRERGGLEVICRGTRLYDSLATEPEPAFWNDNWLRMVVRHPTPHDGTAVSANDFYYRATGLSLHGFYVEEEQTAGEQDHILVADYRWNQQLSSLNNGRNRSNSLAKIWLTDLQAQEPVDATDTGPSFSLWTDGDDPIFGPCDLTHRGWSHERKTSPWQFGNNAHRPETVERWFGYMGSYRVFIDTKDDGESVLIVPSYCSEGLILCSIVEFEDSVSQWRLHERLSAIRVLDNQVNQIDAPNYFTPSGDEQSWSPDGSLSEWRLGGGVNRQTDYLPPGTIAYRFFAYMDLHTTTHSPMRIAQRQFFLAPIGARTDTPGVTRILKTGENAVDVYTEMVGRWQLLYEDHEDELLPIDLEARLATGGPGWFRADFASADFSERQGTRGGMPAPRHGDVNMMPCLHDPDDPDPPETDPPVPELPITPPEAYEPYWTIPGPDSTGRGIGCT